MYLTVKQPQNREEFLQLNEWLKANKVKIALGAIRYSLCYISYENWNPRFVAVSISSNSQNETWAEKCTASGRDLPISALKFLK